MNMSLMEKMAQLRGGDEKEKKVDLFERINAAVEPLLDIDLLRSSDIQTRDRIIKEKVTEAALKISTEENLSLPKLQFEQLIGDICAGITGFGPLERLLRDKEVSEIMTKGPKCIFAEKKGKVSSRTLPLEMSYNCARSLKRL